MSAAGPDLLALGAATLGESGATRMRSRIAAAWPGARLCGPALPVACTPGDNLAVHVAVAHAPEGAVLCVSVGDERELGYWGEVLTTGAQARGIAGLVIDGCVRDVDALEGLAFPVFATGVALTGATKQRPGTVGAPVAVGDLTVHRGDVVVGDRDGVVVLARDDVERITAAAEARAAKEAEMFVALRGGETTVGLLGLDVSPVQVELG